MSAQAEAWRIPDPERPPEQFWTDFKKFVYASYVYEPDPEGEKHDYYWETLIHWADILMKRYDNSIVNAMVMDYLDGQSRRATEKNE